MNRFNPIRDRFLMNERVSAAVNAVLIVAMLTCVATVVIQVGQRLVPEWQGAQWVWVAAAVVLEAVLSARLAHKLNLSTWGWALFRATEVVFIFSLLKLVIYTRVGFGQLWVDLPRWQSNFNTFFDGEYLFACVLNGGIWLAGWMLVGTALEMEGDELLLEPDHGIIETSRQAARQRLGAQVLGIGMVLLFLVALLRSNLNLIGIQAPALQTSLLNVLLYFVLGLVLFSQGHFAVMRATWVMERIKIGPDMAFRWAAYSVALLVAVGLVVSVLPTRYSLGLLGTLNYLLTMVIASVMGALALFVALVSTLIAWVAGLLGLNNAPAVPATPVPLLTPPPDLAPGIPLPWFEVLKSVFFWVVFLGVVSYSVYYYLSQRKGVASLLRRTPLWHWLTGAWRRLRGGMKTLNQALAAAMQAGLQRLRSGPSPEAWRYVNVRNLSPRDRVRFFYLALLRRGGETGLPRRPSQTPYEYETDLTVSLPEVDADLAALTDGFIEARYSQHPISTLVADAMRRHWEQVRLALQARRGKRSR
jgi:hypothetical protein